MSELFFFPSRQGVPAIIPPLLSFTAGFIDSFTVLALFGLFVAQVTRQLCAASFSALPVIAARCPVAKKPRFHRFF
jgi:uncharacterized membrane protein YoaK (UPF0700 family)